MPLFTADSLKEMPGPDRILSMSGLDFMRAVQDGRMSGPPIGKPLNLWLDRVEDGHVIFRGAPEFDSLNVMGTVHGGWYGTLLDSVLSCAAMTKVPQGAMYTTLEYKVNITRTVPLGMEVIADGTVSHAGRSTVVANGEIRGAENGKLYATGSATCMIIKSAKS